MNPLDKLEQIRKQIHTVLPYHEINLNIQLDELKQLLTNQSVDTLVGKVESWAIDKDLHLANPDKQFLKLVEEVGEVAQAYTRKDYGELKLEIGDVIIVLTIFAMQNHMTLEDCLNAAYEKIAKRKGVMRNGIFIKEEDL